MRCLRRTAEVTMRDNIRNDKIRRRLGMKQIIEFIKEKLIKWFGQLTRKTCWYHR
uniref:Uncharacterized protein n=1 Tax=Arion vulgaris TaxID=1028688 RepID=A0A0B7AJC9_9EUPU